MSRALGNGAILVPVSLKLPEIKFAQPFLKSRGPVLTFAVVVNLELCPAAGGALIRYRSLWALQTNEPREFFGRPFEVLFRRIDVRFQVSPCR